MKGSGGEADFDEDEDEGVEGGPAEDLVGVDAELEDSNEEEEEGRNGLTFKVAH